MSSSTDRFTILLCNQDTAGSVYANLLDKSKGCIHVWDRGFDSLSKLDSFTDPLALKPFLSA